ncbi:malonate decarboxylase subunit epsilon [Ralstonia mannitolilytica]|uniref:[acyl-carrier-protein] S-malonyltransferase n=1 Tax=Ralstonia mannitolilytica TaxID=105219 RepID=A0AAD2ALX2_9RALS|nr:malonate decarboxylase subunit epsilon [Ralstonia mannitolilytica]MBY4716920.1 malonate decarboxylase subunit epsilon [Ralstonia mannitolilytica]CAJ0680690.1 Malonyl CoA-acyl carrier protein transacylase [Ralstonia mannitolilytica]CAJ0862699.1 Malonyl CoA-acyl carrier protein transacylase [Ralstonia mannitolilytica]
MSVLFMFPGQGSQRVGMLHALPDDPAVAQTLAEAGDVLGIDPRTLDTAQALQSTVAVQLSLLIAGVAVARTLVRHDAAPDMVTGLSIGAWPAAVIAGVLEFSDALRLVRMRAQLMEDAYPRGYGMVAIVGLAEPEVSGIVAQVHAAATPAYVANLNAERQIVVAGNDAALAQVTERAQAHGASKTTRLCMPVPSHCPLLDAQAAELSAAAASITPHAPQVTYVSSSRARALFRGHVIVEDLAWNMARPVLWHDTLRHALERGAGLAVEVPGGGALARLAQGVFAAEDVLDAGTDKLEATRIRIQRRRRIDG